MRRQCPHGARRGRGATDRSSWSTRPSWEELVTLMQQCISGVPPIQSQYQSLPPPEQYQQQQQYAVRSVPTRQQSRMLQPQQDAMGLQQQQFHAPPLYLKQQSQHVAPRYLPVLPMESPAWPVQQLTEQLCLPPSWTLTPPPYSMLELPSPGNNTSSVGTAPTLNLIRGD